MSPVGSPVLLTGTVCCNALTCHCLAWDATLPLHRLDKTTTTKYLSSLPDGGEIKGGFGVEKRSHCSASCRRPNIHRYFDSMVLCELQERSHAARCLLEDTQKRLQQAETHRNTLEARNRILEGLFFSKVRPTALPSDALTGTADEVGRARSVPILV